MSAIVYRVNRKSGDYIKAAVIPPGRSGQPHFSRTERVIVGLLLLCACGVICLLALN